MLKNQISIAAFDFDGTLTRRDTLWEFLKFVFPKRKLIVGLLRLGLVLAAFKLKLIKNSVAKQRLFEYFFKDMPLDLFNQYCEKFTDSIETFINPAAMTRLQWHKLQGHTCIIISASVENWIVPWALKHNLQVASTRLEVVDGKITGDFFGNNCHGIEKVARLLELYPQRSEYTLYAYGDSSGDKDLLENANFKYFKKFE